MFKCIQAKSLPAGTLPFYFPHILAVSRPKWRAGEKQAMQEQSNGWRTWQQQYQQQKPRCRTNIHSHIFCRPRTVEKVYLQQAKCEKHKMLHRSSVSISVTTTYFFPFREQLEKFKWTSLPLHWNAASIKLKSYWSAHTLPFINPQISHQSRVTAL